MARFASIFASFAILLVAAWPAQAQVAGGACDSTTQTYPCSGSTILYCPTPEDAAADTTGQTTANVWTVAIDCADILGDGMVTGVCYVDANVGGWCAMPVGENCAFSTGTSSLFMACGDSTGAAPNLTCDLDTGICESYPGGCSVDAKICNGNDLIYCGGGAMSWPGALNFDCTGMDVGGTGCSAGACVGLADGSSCNDTEFVCAAGLNCANKDVDGYGTCQAGVGPAPDAGTAPAPDAGSVGPAPDAGSTAPPPDAGSTSAPPDAGSTGGGNGDTNGTTNGGTTNGGATNGTTNGGADDGSGDVKEAPPGGYASGGCFARQHATGPLTGLTLLFFLLGGRLLKRPRRGTPN
jgi:hypothetical protein